MKDNFKDFIENNRKDFDDLIPRDQWKEIHQSIRQSAATSSTLKTISKMFKYGFSASALIIGTFFVVNAWQKTSVSKTETTTPILPQQKPEVPMEPAKKIMVRQAVITHPKVIPRILPLQKKQDKKEPAVVKQSMPYQSHESLQEPVAQKADFLKTEVRNSDSIQTSGRAQIDTIFKGIKSIVVNGTFCDVNVKGTNREDVSLKGSISARAGNAVVLGRQAFKKSEYKIKYERNGSELKVWLEQEKLEHNERVKIDKKEVSFLNFEVPEQTTIMVKNQSGDIQVTGIISPKLQLETSFGNVVAEKIHAEVNINVSSGDISLQDIAGNIKSLSSFGKQMLSNIEGNIYLRSSSGNISIKNSVGNCDVKSSFGFQKYDSVKGEISAAASSGNVSIKNHKGTATVNTTFGKQNYENTEGNIVSNASSGDVFIDGSKGSLILKTSFGSIKGKNVRLSESSEFKTSSGDIIMELLNTANELRFDLHASSGDLDINKNNLQNHSTKSLSAGEGSILVKGISSFGNQRYN